MNADLLNQILALHRENKWQDLLNLNKTEVFLDLRKLLWVWPSESNLQLIKNVLFDFKLSGVISIGCGTGLFEWILQQYSGFPVIGYEVNKEWWTSKYSNPQFIKLIFPELPPTRETLRSDFALLFCYFNSGEAFREYVACYEGNFIIIIGPGPGSGRHTDPEPFHPDFGTKDWVLYKREEVRDTQDFIAVYARIKKLQ